LPSRYNRVLVERESGTEVGGLCIECEEHRLGDRLDWGIRAETEPDRCVLCPGDASVRVPEWDPEMEESPDGTVEWNEYRVTDTTPALCEEHVEEIVDGDPAAESSRRTPPSPSE
jgi:hypothetical protein